MTCFATGKDTVQMGLCEQISYPLSQAVNRHHIAHYYLMLFDSRFLAI